MTASVVIVGVGNSYRRDDGVGPLVAAAIERLALPGVQVLAGIREPTMVLDAWAGASLAVVIDAAVSSAPTSGRIRRSGLGDVDDTPTVSSHSVDIAETIALGRALGRLPDELVLLTVEVADTGHGLGLTPQVAAAAPELVAIALAEIQKRIRTALPPTETDDPVPCSGGISALSESGLSAKA